MQHRKAERWEKGAEPACHCPQQNCVHSTASEGPQLESTPWTASLTLLGDTEGQGLE